MKPSDHYHKWVEWSDEDKVYIGKCPALITGIHGDVRCNCTPRCARRSMR